MRSVDASIDILRRVGRRLAEIRASRSLTQSQLAEAVSVSLQYLQRVEAGKHDIGLTFLARLAAALDVTVRSFLVAPRTLKVARGRPPKRRVSKPTG